MYGPASHSQELWFSIYGRLSQQSSSNTHMSAHNNTDSSSSQQLHNGIVAITAQWCCRDDYISFLSRQLHLVLFATTTSHSCHDNYISFCSQQLHLILFATTTSHSCRNNYILPLSWLNILIPFPGWRDVYIMFLSWNVWSVYKSGHVIELVATGSEVMIGLQLPIDSCDWMPASCRSLALWMPSLSSHLTFLWHIPEAAQFIMRYLRE
jgi:hypothetical protein